MRSSNKLIVAIYDKHGLKLKIINLILTFCEIMYKLPRLTSLPRLLPKIYEKNLKNRINFFADSKDSFMCDETSDWLNRSTVTRSDIDTLVDNPKLYPSPVVTRWNTWFKALVNYNMPLSILVDNGEALISFSCTFLRNGSDLTQR
ncbi:hypothetical protein BpHYR1_039904 [Brachionus plicatilis]|uniref:Uncharacterized protein n=1 Tax=Brachionus plicatilis TaxID=10195 RepID=A0A3M7R2M6_BRAPC|nr:hypothetical protein BpHYR1_039904 [Brachionus plicatilis]